jgi:hypothetical protein
MTFRTEIERTEFLAVDWVDEFEVALKRKDLTRMSAMDYASAKDYFDIAKTLIQAFDRCE